MRRLSRNAGAYARAKQLLEWPMIALSLVFAAALLIPLTLELSATADSALEAVGWLIWAVFAAEYLTLFYLAPDRREMVRSHLLDLAIILVPILRPLRAMRVLQLLRFGAVAGRITVGLRRVLGRRGFSKFLVVIGGMITSAGVLVWLVERDADGGQITTLEDALWWAIVTSTTVGYGDMTPVTAVGRGIAVLLMLVGIGLLSVVTANIAAFFLEESEHDDTAERLDRIEKHLAALAASTGMTSGEFQRRLPLSTADTREGDH